MRLDSKINVVTVFPDGAMINRIASVRLLPDRYVLIIEDVSANVLVNSVLVEVSEDAELKDVKLRDLQVDAKLFKEKLKIEESILNLEKKKQIVDRQIKLIEEIISKHTTISPNCTMVFDTKEAESILLFYQSNTIRLNDQIDEIDKEINKLRDELSTRADEIKQFFKRNRNNKQIEITIVVLNENDIQFDVSYLVEDASWIPAYDINVLPEENTLILTSNALINQNTYEDWNDVKVKLSNSFPYGKGNQPDIRKKEIKLSNSNPANRLLVNEELASQRSDEFTLQRERQLEYERNINETFKPSLDQGSEFIFEVAANVTVKSHGETEKACYRINKFPVHFRHSTLPSSNTNAYLKANFVNDTNFPLLQGKTSVFLKNRFTVTSRLLLTNPQEDIWTFLGTDDNVKIKRKLTRQSQTQGLFKNKIKTTYQYEIEVYNLKKQEIEILVTEILPVSSDPNLIVEMIEPNRKIENERIKIKDDFIIEWLLVVKPYEKIKIPFEFSLEHPSNMFVEELI